MPDELGGQAVSCPTCGRVVEAPRRRARVVAAAPPPKPPPPPRATVVDDDEPATRRRRRRDDDDDDDDEVEVRKRERMRAARRAVQGDDHSGTDRRRRDPDAVRHLPPERERDGGWGINAGVLGGCVMMLVAVVWFVLGLMCGIIFFYPPVLFVLGMVAVVKGLMDG